MYRNRIFYERYSKLESYSEEDASPPVFKYLPARPTHITFEPRAERTITEYKKYSTKEVVNLLVNAWDLLEKVAHSLETITISTGMSIFIVDDKTMKLHRWIKGTVSQYFYDIQPGTILAAYSAYTKKPQVAELSTPNSNYPLGIGKEFNLYVLSLPVVSPNDKVLAVVDLYRDLNGENFSEEDQLIGLTITNWLAAVYEKYRSSQTLYYQNDIHQSMFTILKDYFKVNKDIDKLIESITFFVKNSLDIFSIKFYRILADRQHWAYIYEEVNPNKMTRSKKPKRLNKSYGLLTSVIRSRKLLKLNTNNLDEKYKDLESLRNDCIETVLYIPIVRSESVMGVVQLTNKLNGNEFTKHDEEFLETVCKYYSIALHYANVSSKQKEVEEQLRDEKRLFIFMLQPCKHELTKLIKNWHQIKTSVVPERFFTFSYYPWQAGEFKLMELSLILFSHTVADIFEDEESMVRFIIMSKKVYRKNLYHNFEHAFNVTHFMMNIKKLTENVFNELEWKALIVASFCHDMDHPGFTNNFLKATSHYMVELYQESVLENHHSYVAHLLIKEMKLFLKFSSKDYKFIMNEIHNAIIATDLAIYFGKSKVITSIITNNCFSWSKPEHMQLLKGVMMTTCDLSGQFKPCDIAVGLSMQLYKEFYLQGDKEKCLGLKPMTMMDRELTLRIPTDQIDFIMLICVPCVDILVTFLPQLNPILANVPDLINYWLAAKKKQGFKSEKEEEMHQERIREMINKRFKTNLEN